jgi:hypothetical protein
MMYAAEVATITQHDPADKTIVILADGQQYEACSILDKVIETHVVREQPSSAQAGLGGYAEPEDPAFHIYNLGLNGFTFGGRRLVRGACYRNDSGELVSTFDLPADQVRVLTLDGCSCNHASRIDAAKAELMKGASK